MGLGRKEGNTFTSTAQALVETKVQTNKTSFPTFNEESRDLMHQHLRVKVVSMYFQVRTAIVLSDVSDEIAPTHKSGHER